MIHLRPLNCITVEWNSTRRENRCKILNLHSLARTLALSVSIEHLISSASEINIEPIAIAKFIIHMIFKSIFNGTTNSTMPAIQYPIRFFVSNGNLTQEKINRTYAPNVWKNQTYHIGSGSTRAFLPKSVVRYAMNDETSVGRATQIGVIFTKIKLKAAINLQTFWFVLM